MMVTFQFIAVKEMPFVFHTMLQPSRTKGSASCLLYCHAMLSTVNLIVQGYIEEEHTIQETMTLLEHC